LTKTGFEGKKFLVPDRHRKKIRHHPYIAFDVENNVDTGKFICAYFAGKYKNIKTGKELFFEHYSDNYNDFKRIISDVISKMHTKLVSYNLSYDELFLVEVVDHSKTLRSGSKIIKAETYEGIEIIDIQNISGIEYSLEQWINFLNMEKKYGIKKQTLDNLYLRVKYDTLATYYLTEFIEDFFVDELHSPMKITIGSCALEIYNKNYHDEYWIRDYDEKIDDLERKAYKGGHNEIYKRGLYEVDSYDIVSMYLSVIHDNYFPNPISAVYIEAPDKLKKGWKYYFDNYLCILDVLVKIPDQYIAPLPYRVIDEKKIHYPVGSFRDVYTNEELKYAILHGAEIVKVYSMIYYKEKKKYFEDFSNMIWNNRKLYKYECVNLTNNVCKDCHYNNMKDCSNYIKNDKQNRGMEIMIKKIGNSLIGKFGQKNSIYTYYGKECDLPVEIDLTSCRYENTKECPNKKGCQCKDKTDCPTYENMYNLYHTTIDDIFYISVTSKETVDSNHSFCCIASFVTAYARIKILKLLKQNEKYVIYTDTDSIKVISGKCKYDTGKELGDLSYEYTAPENFYSCKNYGDKCKGVKKNSKILDYDYDNGLKHYQYKSPLKFKSYLRRKERFGKWFDLEKIVSMKDTKRKWYGDKFYGQGIESKPIKLEYKEKD
jgi:hypothetical protein